MFMGNKTYQNYMSDADIIEVYKKDRKAGNEKMIEKYRDYIYYVIKKYYPTFHNETPDMFQHGAIGMMNAMTSYDASKGAFTTHCTPYIKKEISKYVRFMASESSEYFASLNTAVEREKTKIETNGQEVTVENIAEATGLSHKIAKRELKVDHTKVSYEVLAEVGTSMSLTDDFIVDDILSGIPPESSCVIKMKVVDGLPFTTIAKQLGKTVFRVRQDYHDGIGMLREKMAC